jgi:DNA-binding CsgD family transcriptional regulator
MPSLPAALRLTPAFPFAGRTRELATLRALLPRSENEGRRAAVLAGEPGSGKSRLVRELAHELAAEDTLVLYGACDVVSTPYGPFVQALEHVVRHRRELELDAALDAGGPELARLLPELRSPGAEPGTRAAVDPDTERLRLHSAVVDLLAAAAAHRPVLLVLEDVHWADTPTLVLLRHLVRAGGDVRMLLVVTYRDVEADVPAELSEVLVDVGRTEGVVRMSVGALSGEEVAEFVRLAAGVDAATDLAVGMEKLTEGNAFFVTELWRELSDSGAVEVAPSGVRLVGSIDDIGTPETVREVVSHRLARMSPATVEMLQVAAIAGAEFELALVRAALREAEGALLDAIDEATRSGLLFESPGRGLSFRFAHELVRRSVLSRMSAVHRAELHLRVAEALEGLPADDAGARLSALAHHFDRAAEVGGHDRAVAYNLLAAESATASLAFDDAASHLRTALDLGIADPRARAASYLELGRASHRAGRSVDALGALGESARLAREIADVELLADAAVSSEEACWRPGIHEARTIELLVEAIEAVGVDDRERRTRLLGALARALDFAGDHDRAELARAEAIAQARAAGDRATLGWVLAAAFWSRDVHSYEEIGVMIEEAARIGEELGDVELHTEALAWLVPTFVARCDHVSARAALERLFAAARRNAQPFHLHVAEHYSSALALCDGRLAAAEAAADRSWEWSRLLTGRDASGVRGIQMFGIRREQGRLAELAPVVRLLAGTARDGAWVPALCLVLAELGMEAEARRELGRVTEDSLAPLRSSLWLASVVYLAEACVILDDERVAALLYPELERRAGGNIQIGHLVACYGAADRHLGSIAATLGDWDVAQAHFEGARALNARLGARTWLAHTEYEHARMLLRRGRPEDRSEASAALGRALALATEIGMPALAARATALGQHVRPAPIDADGLSARELQILALVTRGLSNREIGAELSISEHTAANHVRSILRKTGCSNRTEAAAYAHRRRLVATP